MSQPMRSILAAWCGGIALFATAVAPSFAVALSKPFLASDVALKQATELVVRPDSKPLPGLSHFEVALSDLVPDTKVLSLHGLTDVVHMNLPIPSSWRVSRLELTLHGVASRALLQTSELIVMVNGVAVGQLPLAAADGGFTRRISIDPSQLHAGFNDLSFQAAHHSTLGCESNFGPELWSQIYLNTSLLAADTVIAPAPTTLDRMNDVFDKAEWKKSSTTALLTIRAPTEALMPALGLIAQGIGRRYDFLPVAISQRRVTASWSAIEKAMPESSRSAVLVGTFEQLAGLLRESGIPTNAGPVLALHPLPSDPTRVVVVMAGASEAEVTRMAIVFATPQAPLPHQVWVTSDKVTVPTADAFENGSDATTAAEGAFALSAINYRTTTVTGMDSARPVVRVWSGSWQGHMQLRIHLTYAAGMGTQSALNVLANGILQGSIPLSDPSGGGYDNYAVSIPAGALSNGWNFIQFQPILIPVSNGGECRPFFPGNLALTLYEDTTVQKFAGSSLRRPDLSLLAGNGAPYTDAPLGSRLVIAVTDFSESTLSSGATLIAKLAQVYHGPLLDAHFRLGTPADKSDEIWIGPYPALPTLVRTKIREASPSHLIAQLTIADSQLVPARDLQWLARFREKLHLDDGSNRELFTAQMGLGSDSSEDAIAVNVQDSDGATTAFTAANGAVLERAMSHLVDYGPWSQLRGTLTIWSADHDQIASVSAEDSPFTSYGLRGGLSVWFSQNPWLTLLLVTALIAIMIYLTTLTLRLYRRRNP